MDPLTELVGESPGVVALQEKIRRLLTRQSDARRLPPILLLGETGTGKGLLARMIHRLGPRREGPFVDVNCAAIPPTLIEGEMFGFERGAFTDAKQAKLGLFHAAHRGTIFLDEVGLLPDALQAKLLKVIEERVVRRLGSTRSDPVDVWIVAATNENLEAAVAQRRFREDLYHRLAVLALQVPPLRERGPDILLLARHFLDGACADYEVPGKSLAPDARAALAAYPWPGNVRELRNVMERVALLSETTEVTAELLGLPFREAPPDEPAPAEPLPLDRVLASAEHDELRAALRETDWNVSRAAIRLGISRNTLRYRMEKYGLRAGGPPTRRRPVERPVEHPSASPARAAAEMPAPFGIRWERRWLTLLRISMVVPVGAEIRPGVHRQVEVLVEKVRSFGGSIEELSPTGVVATFGLEPVEDGPRRAALAAIAIQKAAEHARNSRTEPADTKLAIHVGQFLVAVGQGATGIDMNAKLEAWRVLDALVTHADANMIVVSPTAASLLERRFNLIPRDPVVSVPGRVYQLAGLERIGLASGRRLAEFVGRRQDLELLRGRLEPALRGHGQIVGIAGEAGIGKSRLLFEFRRSLAGQPVTYRQGQCVSYGGAITHLPIVEIVKAQLGITDADTPESLRERIEAGLEAVGMDPLGATPYLLHLLGPEEGAERLATVSPELIKARILETLREYIGKCSQRQPLVIAVEDLHWADPSSEEALGFLVEAVAGARILVVATYRPGYRPSWIHKSYATQIALQPLGPADSLNIVRSMLQPEPVPGAIAELVLTKAEGNPFFLEELCHAIGTPGELPPTLAVPDTIQEVILARIHRLPEPTRALLQAASVLGREVAWPLLKTIWDGASGPEAELRELVSLEFLYEATAAGEPRYVFRHALTQEVAYSSLLEDRRRAYHAAAGFALEQLYAGRLEEIVELLAYHFDRGEQGEKAIDYAILAAEKAQGRWANAEALVAFETALKRLDTLPDTTRNRLRRIDAILKQAEVKFALGRHAEHIQELERIRELVERDADPPRRAAWYYWTGFLHSLTGGRPDAAIAACSEAAAIGAAHGLEEIRASAEACLVQACLVAGDLHGATAVGERALATFEARGNIWWAGRTLSQLGTVANALGEWRRALDYCRRSLDHGLAVNDLRLKVSALFRTGSTLIQRGDATGGLERCEAALNLKPIPFDAAFITAIQGYGLIKTGKIAAGITQLTGAVRWFQHSHLGYTRSLFTLWLADGYLRLGERDQARQVLDEVLPTCHGIGYRHLEGIALRLWGEALGPDDAGAIEPLDRAVRILEGVGARNELAKALVARAHLFRAVGDPAMARQLLERALSIFDALGTLDEPARARAVLVTLGPR